VRTTVSVAFLGLVLHFVSSASAIAATTNISIVLPPPEPDSVSAEKQEEAWYSHVEAEAKAGRGRAQVPSLVAMIDGSDAHKRELAAQLLSDIGKDANDAVPSLIRHINDPDFFPRLRCIEALGDIGPDAFPAVSDLIKVLNDPDYPIANMAAWALGEIGPKAQQAVPELEATILHRPKDSHYYAMVAVTCRVALAHITRKPDLQVVALISMLSEKDDKKNYSLPALEATRALVELMPASKIALPDIGQELINPNTTSTARAEAAKDLGIFGDPQAIPFLQKAIHDDPEITVRNVAIDAFGKIEGAKVDTAQLYKDSQAKEFAPWWKRWFRFYLWKLSPYI
jgi:HEAT repeat protein